MGARNFCILGNVRCFAPAHIHATYGRARWWALGVTASSAAGSGLAGSGLAGSGLVRSATSLAAFSDEFRAGGVSGGALLGIPDILRLSAGAIYKGKDFSSPPFCVCNFLLDEFFFLAIL